jgi:hypothetical protein
MPNLCHGKGPNVAGILSKGRRSLYRNEHSCSIFLEIKPIKILEFFLATFRVPVDVVVAFEDVKKYKAVW